MVAKMIVYIEYVLIDNLVISYLLLKATFVLTGNKVSKGRLFLSSIFGTGMAFIYPLISNQIISFAIKILTAIVMILLGFSTKAIRSYYIALITFLALTFMTGGAITALTNLFSIDESNEILIAVVVLPAYILIKALTELVKYFYRRKRIENYTCPCELKIKDQVLTVKGFVDTGNNLYDGDKPVVICDINLAKELIFSLVPLPKIKELEFRTVSGIDKMKAVDLDEIKIFYSKDMHINNNVTLGISRNGVGEGYDIILHPALVEGKENESNIDIKKVS